MWWSLAVVLGGLVFAGVVLKWVSWAQRERFRRLYAPEKIERELRGVSLRVLTQGPPILTGMKSSRVNRTTGDIFVAHDALLIVCTRGKLVEIRPGVGRRLDSVRTPGPQLLVLEGSHPMASGPPGSYRIELVVEDAKSWVRTLEAFASEEAPKTPWIGETA